MVLSAHGQTFLKASKTPISPEIDTCDKWVNIHPYLPSVSDLQLACLDMASANFTEKGHFIILLIFLNVKKCTSISCGFNEHLKCRRGIKLADGACNGGGLFKVSPVTKEKPPPAPPHPPPPDSNAHAHPSRPVLSRTAPPAVVPANAQQSQAAGVGGQGWVFLRMKGKGKWQPVRHCGYFCRTCVSGRRHRGSGGSGGQRGRNTTRPTRPDSEESACQRSTSPPPPHATTPKWIVISDLGV